MKIKEGFMLQSVAGSNVVVPIGATALSFRGMLTLNEIGAFVWKALETDNTPEKIAEEIVKEYEVDFETALNDVNAFVDKLREKDFIEE
ncbi:MAG: PqqD family protein [Clostridia bacterium]|nr:PqqD family protein [Clostridia bacterium]